ncbi:hypothetical protein U1Q18_015420, partial [Sarracenia purpurea var. burkii]
ERLSRIAERYDTVEIRKAAATLEREARRNLRTSCRDFLLRDTPYMSRSQYSLQPRPSNDRSEPQTLIDRADTRRGGRAVHRSRWIEERKP